MDRQEERSQAAQVSEPKPIVAYALDSHISFWLVRNLLKK